MQYRALGGSGVTVSRVGFGCGDRAGLMVGTDRAEQDRLVGRALDAGITYFDTAAKYGAGESERNLGRALRAHGRAAGTAVIGTKLELPPDAEPPFAATVRAHLHASLERLGTDHVHLYQLHDRIGGAGWGPQGAKRLTVPEVLGPGGVAEALVELRREGKVSALGLTTFGGDPRAVGEVVRAGLFDTINCSFHMLNPTALVAAPRGWPATDYGQVAALAHAQGMTVLGIRALGGGQLLGAAAPHPEVAGTDAVRRAFDTALNGTAAEKRAHAAMAWVLGWQQVGCLIAGISAAAHVDDAVAAADAGMWSGPAVRAWCETLYRAAVPAPQEEEETIAWRR